MVIVEGPSEESALGSILKEYFSNEEVQVAVVHGDITTADYVSTDNIVKRINELMNQVGHKYGYTTDDFLRIIHIADTDGVFTQNSIVEKDVSGVQYYTNRIETKNVNYIRQRNSKKLEILFKLRTTGKINGIKYRIYFNSCNLEHVLYNELRDFSDEEKEIMSDDFDEKYEGKVSELCI